MFRRIVFAAAAAGLLAGLIVSAIQSVGAIPLILKAETYENAGPQSQKGAAPPQATVYRQIGRLLGPVVGESSTVRCDFCWLTHSLTGGTFTLARSSCAFLRFPW